MEQAVRAEEMNFDGVWFAEHHFSDLGITPSHLHNKEEIDKILPWSTVLPPRCRVPKKSEDNKK
ncbi:hypothetical protein ACQKD9_26455 [Bacillus paramycoides]|uniref:hypothetical protein n=1 Tax=Bacillus paramycoides TaxID=2026194 RepID=UPI003D07D1D2